MHGLELEFQDRLLFLFVDAATPEGVRLQDEFSVRGHPTIVLLDGNGRVWQRYYGLQPADSLREALQTMISNPHGQS